MRTIRYKVKPSIILVFTVIASVVLCQASDIADTHKQRNHGDSAHEYSQASLSGNYAFVGTYAANIAANFGVVTFDGMGSAKGAVTVNQPGPAGSRTIVKVTLSGTYTVQSDGTGTIQFTVSLPSGTTSDVTEDFVITRAKNRNGTLLATSIFEAQEQPSVIISGDVFVVHNYTRRPD